MSNILSKLINFAGNVTGTLAVANGGTGVTTSTGSGNTVLSTSPTLVTPVLGAATATSINFGGQTLSNYDEGTFSVTFTSLTGSATNTGGSGFSAGTNKYRRIGNNVFCTIQDIHWSTPLNITGVGYVILTVAETSLPSFSSKTSMGGAGTMQWGTSQAVAVGILPDSLGGTGIVIQGYCPTTGNGWSANGLSFWYTL